MNDPEIKYEKINVKDIEKGDIIYYKQRQEGNLDEPYKFRPFLVAYMGDVNDPSDTIDVIPITHSDPRKKDYCDPLANYNVKITPELQQILKQKSGDKRNSFLNSSQEVEFELTAFTKECKLQRMAKRSEYPKSEFRENMDNVAKGQNKLDDDYPAKIAKKWLSMMHQGSFIDETAIEAYPLDNYPVGQAYLDKCDSKQKGQGSSILSPILNAPKLVARTQADLGFA